MATDEEEYREIVDILQIQIREAWYKKGFQEGAEAERERIKKEFLRLASFEIDKFNDKVYFLDEFTFENMLFKEEHK